MPKFFVKTNQIEKDKIKIIGEDVKHINQVLRAKIGEELTICNLDTTLNYITTVSQITPEYVICNIQDCVKSFVESNIQVTIFQGLPKADKMELIIQKSVELGVYEITPIEMKRCVVKLNEKDKIKKIDRWQKISEVAAKQCGRNIIPNINQIINLKNVCNLFDKYDIVLVAYENENKNTLKNELEKIKQKYNNREIKIGVIIGPEGGIDSEEIKMLQENGAITITLGKRILRTETVALNVLSIIMYELEN